MGRETRDTRQDKAGAGGDDLADGLDKASEQAAQLNDEALAALFIEANEEARSLDSPPARDLFVEEKRVHHVDDVEPDPAFLREIYDSLTRKEIHHKKLLEENAPTGRLMRIVHALRTAVRLPTHREEEPIAPVNWRIFARFHREWRRGANAYVGNFSSLTDLHLRRRDYAKFMLKWEFGAMFLILALCIPVMVLFAKSFFSTNAHAMNFAVGWSSFILYSSAAACAAAVTPLFFFVSLWFVNVNRLHTSRYFHMFLFLSFTLAFVLMALSLFNAALFYWVDHQWGITSHYETIKGK